MNLLVLAKFFREDAYKPIQADGINDVLNGDDIWD